MVRFPGRRVNNWTLAAWHMGPQGSQNLTELCFLAAGVFNDILVRNVACFLVMFGTPLVVNFEQSSCKPCLGKKRLWWVERNFPNIFWGYSKFVTKRRQLLTILHRLLLRVELCRCLFCMAVCNRQRGRAQKHTHLSPGADAEPGSRHYQLACPSPHTHTHPTCSVGIANYFI